MKSIIGIDPGSKNSAYIQWTGKEILAKGIYPNEKLLELLELYGSCSRESIDNVTLAIESMEYIYIPKSGRLKDAGKDILDTVRWEERFYQVWQGEKSKVPAYVIRKALGTNNNKGIRDVLIQRFGAPGSKNRPGVTHGLGATGYHLWRAFAVAVVWMDHLEFQGRELK